MSLSIEGNVGITPLDTTLVAVDLIPLYKHQRFLKLDTAIIVGQLRIIKSNMGKVEMQPSIGMFDTAVFDQILSPGSCS